MKTRERTKAVVTLSAALVIGLVAGGATFSAFNAQTTSTANSFGAGTVSLTDNDSGSAMFTVPALRPGTPATRCIQVTSTGTLPVGVKLFGATTGGTGLEAFLNVTVTRGTITTPTFPDCTGFTADSGGGVVYSGTMGAFPSTYAGAVADPNTAWAAGEKHVYQFAVEVQDNAGAEGKTATQTFTWDAR